MIGVTIDTKVRDRWAGMHLMSLSLWDLTWILVINKRRDSCFGEIEEQKRKKDLLHV